MEKLLKKLRKIIRNSERGFAFPMVLALLLIGGIIIAPLLSYTNTGLAAGKNSEYHMERLYAADAGVEDALWNLMTENITMEEGDTENLSLSNVNGNNVSVTIDSLPDMVYKITSVASGVGSTDTTLEVYATGLDFRGLFDNAVTSRADITWQPGASTNGTTEEDYADDWPDADDFKDYYLDQVDTSNPYGSDTVDIKTRPVILPTGPLYRDGDLNIINTGTPGDLGTLNGTIYVAGDLDMGLTNKDFTLDLNNQTIFVEGTIEIGGKCTITGSGCIIAVGDVDFAPNMNTTPPDFVFVMSIEGTIFMHPNGDFYGSIAGDTEVQMQPGCDIQWNDPSGTDLNFPPGITAAVEILAWKISP